MKTLPLLILASLLALTSCKSSKQENAALEKKKFSPTIEKNVNNTQANTLIQEGYTPAEVVIDNEKSATCSMMLKITTGKVVALLDPVEMDKSSLVNGDVLYVKYRRLRMRNRCGEAWPVAIESFEKVQK